VAAAPFRLRKWLIFRILPHPSASFRLSQRHGAAGGFGGKRGVDEIAGHEVAISCTVMVQKRARIFI